MYFKTFILHGLIFILLVLRILHNHFDLYLKIPKEINCGLLLMERLGVTFSLPFLSIQFLSSLFIGCLSQYVPVESTDHILKISSELRSFWLVHMITFNFFPFLTVLKDILIAYVVVELLVVYCHIKPSWEFLKNSSCNFIAY